MSQWSRIRQSCLPCCAQSAADDLREQDFRFRRPGQDDAAHVPVNAGGQRADVADDLDLAIAQSLADALRSSGGVSMST